MNAAVRMCKRRPGAAGASRCKIDGGPIPAVAKVIERGPSGGLFYRTKTGTKVYLRRTAGRNLKRRCREGSLTGVVRGCGAAAGFAPQAPLTAPELAIYGDLPRNRVRRPVRRRRRV